MSLLNEFWDFIDGKKLPENYEEILNQEKELKHIPEVPEDMKVLFKKNKKLPKECTNYPKTITRMLLEKWPSKEVEITWRNKPLIIRKVWTDIPGDVDLDGSSYLNRMRNFNYGFKKWVAGVVNSQIFELNKRILPETINSVREIEDRKWLQVLYNSYDQIFTKQMVEDYIKWTKNIVEKTDKDEQNFSTVISKLMNLKSSVMGMKGNMGGIDVEDEEGKTYQIKSPKKLKIDSRNEKGLRFILEKSTLDLTHLGIVDYLVLMNEGAAYIIPSSGISLEREGDSNIIFSKEKVKAIDVNRGEWISKEI